MDPATIALVSMGSSAAGGTLGAFGKLAEGKASSQMYQYQAGVAQFNQKIAEQNRDWAYQTGERQAEITGIKGRQQIGAIKAAQSGSNLDVNSGTAVQVRESQRSITQMDMETIRSNAAKQAYGYTVEATKYAADTGMYMKAASDVRKASYIGAASSLLSGATSVSSKWMQARDAGMFAQSNPVDVGSATSYGT